MTQFPVEISNEDAFASFKNVRHVTIKKVIEGGGKGTIELKGVNLKSFFTAFLGQPKFRYNDN